MIAIVMIAFIITGTIWFAFAIIYAQTIIFLARTVGITLFITNAWIIMVAVTKITTKGSFFSGEIM
jgi:hypothetical protein